MIYNILIENTGHLMLRKLLQRDAVIYFIQISISFDLIPILRRSADIYFTSISFLLYGKAW